MYREAFAIHWESNVRKTTRQTKTLPLMTLIARIFTDQAGGTKK
jgi:hypothetical protein